MSYFSCNIHRKKKIEVVLDLSNYATKSDLKNATGVDISQFAEKGDLANLKLEADMSGIDKLEKYRVVYIIWKVK